MVYKIKNQKKAISKLIKRNHKFIKKKSRKGVKIVRRNIVR